jgi:hypothetical protein
MHSPGRSSTVLLPDDAPPTRMYLVMAAPAGGTYIPLGVLQDLGEVNGLGAFQLVGTARDGTVVLPQFLSPGTYNLYITVKRGGTSLYDKVGSVTLPAERNMILNYKQH